jgi:dimethylargininase
MRIAITRGVSPNIERCELTHLEREAINVDLAREQHRRYEECLAELGCDVQRLPAEPGLPDSVFVEDTAVVVDELAVITRPGAESRRPEVSSIAEVLGEHRRLEHVVEPGVIDGGDVLVLDRDVYIGLSGRTNEDAVRQVRAALGPSGYTVTTVPVKACLHLKSAVGRVASDALLINRQWADATAFGSARLIDVDPAEPGAAGALLIEDTVVYPARFECTLRRLGRAGIRTAAIELSELAKAEAGVTCCSLVFEG